MPIIGQNPNTITWGTAKSRVAGVVGNSGDTPQETIAGEALEDVIRDLNAAREWTWLQRTATGNVTTDGLITLPSRAAKIHSVLVNNNPLTYADKRDEVRQSNGFAFGGVFFYSDYNTAETNALEVLDHPAATQPYEVNYLSKITLNYTDGQAVDVPEDVMGYILARAKANYLANTVDSENAKLSSWSAIANRRYAALVRQDSFGRPDQEVTFTPGWLGPVSFTPHGIDPDWFFG